jgi:hypothetical protein
MYYMYMYMCLSAPTREAATDHARLKCHADRRGIRKSYLTPLGWGQIQPTSLCEHLHMKNRGKFVRRRRPTMPKPIDLLEGDVDHHAAIGSDEALLSFLKWEQELEQEEERLAAAKEEKRKMLETIQFGESCSHPIP